MYKVIMALLRFDGRVALVTGAGGGMVERFSDMLPHADCAFLKVSARSMRYCLLQEAPKWSVRFLFNAQLG